MTLILGACTAKPTAATIRAAGTMITSAAGAHAVQHKGLLLQLVHQLRGVIADVGFPVHMVLMHLHKHTPGIIMPCLCFGCVQARQQWLS